MPNCLTDDRNVSHTWVSAVLAYTCYMLTTETTVCPNGSNPIVRSPHASASDFDRYLHGHLTYAEHFGKMFKFFSYLVFFQPNMSNPYYCELDDVGFLLNIFIQANASVKYAKSGAIELYWTTYIL